MKVKESIEQLNSLITHFNNGGLDFNATDIEAIKCLLNKRQKLISYLKERENKLQKKVVYYEKQLKGTERNTFYYNSYVKKIHKLNTQRELTKEILSKIEKE